MAETASQMKEETVSEGEIYTSVSTSQDSTHLKVIVEGWLVVVHVFNPETQEAEASGSL